MAKDKVYQLRLTEEERALFEDAAGRSNEKLSTWIRKSLTLCAGGVWACKGYTNPTVEIPGAEMACQPLTEQVKKAVIRRKEKIEEREPLSATGWWNGDKWFEPKKV